MSSPTQRTLALLLAEGWTAAITEHWNPHARIRQALFGFVDVLAVRGPETLAVQTTSGSNVSARVRKIEESEHLPAIRDAGWGIEVHGWRKDKKGKWQCRRVNLS